MRDTALEQGYEDLDGELLPELEDAAPDAKNFSNEEKQPRPRYAVADGSAVLEVRGQLVSPVLALRVLHRYLEPAAVAQREAARQLAGRHSAWTFLPANDAERMVSFRTCSLCEERHWCVNMDPPSPRGYCEDCFNDLFSE